MPVKLDTFRRTLAEIDHKSSVPILFPLDIEYMQLIANDSTKLEKLRCIPSILFEAVRFGERNKHTLNLASQFSSLSHVV